MAVSTYTREVSLPCTSVPVQVSLSNMTWLFSSVLRRVMMATVAAAALAQAGSQAAALVQVMVCRSGRQGFVLVLWVGWADTHRAQHTHGAYQAGTLT